MAWNRSLDWIRDVDLLTGLRAYAADPDLQQEWMIVKKVNKMRLAEYIEAMSGVKVWS
ncbi:glycogen phosphorylase 1 [Prunus yedoensis var. nudiflora]|uniref:Glycogen phosphorylase 1 n=1 Tax=Prunus yedoensis var. nudiflora TaxID=2094558 RepID=A0A314UKX0_PRUYE|nr:glycogen phosphorylase 1 [Prunus yedoensis var. nudiflora]